MGAASSLTPGGTQTSLKGDFRAICLGSERLFARIRQAVAVQAAPATLRSAFLEPISQRLAGDLSLELFARRDDDVMGMFAGQSSLSPPISSPSLFRAFCVRQLAPCGSSSASKSVIGTCLDFYGQSDPGGICMSVPGQHLGSSKTLIAFLTLEESELSGLPGRLLIYKMQCASMPLSKHLLLGPVHR